MQISPAMLADVQEKPPGFCHASFGLSGSDAQRASETRPELGGTQPQCEAYPDAAINHREVGLMKQAWNFKCPSGQRAQWVCNLQ